MYHRSLLTAICLVCLATTGMAETQAEPDKASVSDFLTPNGQFDIEAARQAGFEGSLDLDGFDVRFDQGLWLVFYSAKYDVALRAGRLAVFRLPKNFLRYRVILPFTEQKTITDTFKTNRAAGVKRTAEPGDTIARLKQLDPR